VRCWDGGICQVPDTSRQGQDIHIFQWVDMACTGQDSAPPFGIAKYGDRPANDACSE
jgi:hypothetical protein